MLPHASTRPPSSGRRSRIAAAAVAASLCGCASVVRPASPYERYSASLERADLGSTALGRDWLRAGAAALAAPVTAALPFRETSYAPVERATAVAYRLTLARGRRFVADVTFETAAGGRLFVDLFRIDAGDEPDRVASLADDATSLVYDVERDGDYVLRVQPELLRGGRFTIVERTLASLRFPIAGANAESVQSAFGVARDAGAREHEGIDIFVPRGTPVLAVIDGNARPDTNALGGNVVWLSAGFAGRRFYYAHLDRWEIAGTVRVRAGDVLGYVGNTGNARTTSPHLHFGIYDGGAIDPLPFVAADDPIPPAPAVPLDRLDTWIRVTAARASIRGGAEAGDVVRRDLERGWVARVAGLSGSSLRIELPDESAGYVSSSQVVPAATNATRTRLAAGSDVRERPADTSPLVARLDEGRGADVLGRFADFDLVTSGGLSGWVRRRP